MSLVSFGVKILSDIFGINPAKLPQQLLRPFVEHLRQHEPHFNDQVAAAAVSRRRDATLAQAKPLTGLRARWHPHARTALERWHVNLRAKRGLVKRDRDDDVKVIAFATKQRMPFDAHGNKQVAVLAALSAGVPLAHQADSGAVVQPRRNVNGQRFMTHLQLPSSARDAARFSQDA